MHYTINPHSLASYLSRLAPVSARILLAAVIAMLATNIGCGTRTEEESSPAAFRPTASIQDLMLSVLDPAADAIWQSVATIVTHDGTEELRPRTDEDWEALRHEAVRLVESTNLLLINDRAVARPGFRSENPGIELEPEEIQVLIDEAPEEWDQLVANMYRASVRVLTAIENRDVDRLFDEGGPLNETCERCHQRYWYPGDTPPQRAAAEEAAFGATASDQRSTTVATGGTSTIQGHIQLSGELPGNQVIRMGVDPRCSQLIEGKQILQESVLTARDGSLANVFVHLEGDFPETPIPDEPVVINQKDCVFTPRVVGARVGQIVQITNNDPLLHNLNSMTTTTNRFNVGQPIQGMAYKVQLTEEEGMLRIRCDLHRWMTEYTGVLPHSHFDVTDLSGTFRMSNVPAGTHTIQTWHEEYGVLTQTATVETDAVAVINFTYPATAH